MSWMLRQLLSFEEKKQKFIQLIWANIKWIDYLKWSLYIYLGFPGDSMVKKPPTNAGEAGDSGLISGSRRSPEGGNGNPLQHLKIPWAEKPPGLQSMALKESDMTEWAHEHFSIPYNKFLRNSTG